MQLPNFLVLGSQKSGSTSLYHILRRHPEIYMPETKEINFFFYEEKYARGLSYYETYFEDATPEQKMVGEASPGYICHPQVPQRIKKDLPGIQKLIVTVRNPIERAFSQYADNIRHLEATVNFDKAFESALQETFEPGQLGYFSRGTYIQYIERYVELFGRESVLVLLFEDLLNDPANFYRGCFEFLDVDPDFKCPEMERTFNASTIWNNPVYRWFYARPQKAAMLPDGLRRLICRGGQSAHELAMAPEIEVRLREFYRPWNDRLGEFLDRDLSEWNSP